MKFHFPKGLFDNYEDVVKFDVDNDVRVSIMLHPDMKILWKGFRSRLRGTEVELYSKSEDGMLEPYARVKLNTSSAVDKILTTHIIFEYAGEIRSMFGEFNNLCRSGKVVGRGSFVDEEIGRCRMNFKTREVKMVMNISAYGILSMGKEYFDVVGTSLLFNYIFSKWVVEHGGKFRWLEGKDWIISRCEYLCDNVFRPIIDERLEKMKKVMELCVSGAEKVLEVVVYEYFKKYNVIDVEMPTLDIYEILVETGSDINQFKKVVYDMYRRGILEAEGVESTFVDGKFSIPRKYRLKKK